MVLIPPVITSEQKIPQWFAGTERSKTVPQPSVQMLAKSRHGTKFCWLMENISQANEMLTARSRHHWVAKNDFTCHSRTSHTLRMLEKNPGLCPFKVTRSKQWSQIVFITFSSGSLPRRNDAGEQGKLRTHSQPFTINHTWNRQGQVGRILQGQQQASWALCLHLCTQQA